nr:hypothetical protein [Haloferax sp. ATB1]
MLGLGVALLTVAVVYLVMDRTGFGYDLVTSGYQEPAAKYSGVDPKRMIVRTMTISGMIAGLAGALFAVMILGYYSDPSTFPTFGFDAIAVSLLAANNPLGVIPAGLLFGGLDAGGQYIGFTLDVPSELVDGVIGSSSCSSPRRSCSARRDSTPRSEVTANEHRSRARRRPPDAVGRPRGARRRHRAPAFRRPPGV